jgi:hypothetical protein
MLWASLLFFTGMRPGEAAYTEGYKDEGHYLRVKVYRLLVLDLNYKTCSHFFLLKLSQNVEVKRLGDDSYGPQLSIEFTVSWTKHNRYRNER